MYNDQERSSNWPCSYEWIHGIWSTNGRNWPPFFLSLVTNVPGISYNSSIWRWMSLSIPLGTCTSLLQWLMISFCRQGNVPSSIMIDLTCSNCWRSNIFSFGNFPELKSNWVPVYASSNCNSVRFGRFWRAAIGFSVSEDHFRHILSRSCREYA